jgi:ribonuclease HI
VTNLVIYTDGSCSPNPGNGGFGLYGYTYNFTEKNKNFKHPIHSKCYFTRDGILPNRDKDNLEVLEVIEYIKSLDGSFSTNNEAELLAVLTALEKGKAIENLESISIFTDSNYIVTSFNDHMHKWLKNNWRKMDGNTIAHKDIWLDIYENYKWYKSKDIHIRIEWVKGHAKRYGNNIADLYANAGSNASKQYEEAVVVLDKVSSFADYRKSYPQKDFIHFFRDLYFSSDDIDDGDYCFISTSEDPETSGKRNTSSIFVTNIGFKPKVIDEFKKIFRSIERNYVTTCCIRLTKLNNKDMLRLLDMVDTKYLLSKLDDTTISLIGDPTPFIFENIGKQPFINYIYETFSKVKDIHEKNTSSSISKYDITDLIIKDNKILITNKDKFVDYTEVIDDNVKIKQKLILRIGYDIPSYLSLKNIEKSIQKVYVVLETNDDCNFYTLYTDIITTDREIYSVNVTNKFLKSIV